MVPYEINPEAVEIVYQDALRERYQVNVVCTTNGDWVLNPASTPDSLGPVSEFSCQMPSSLPATPENPGDFWVVVRGRHGERGASFLDEAFPMRANGWKTDDFVVAFEHQQTRLVIMDAVPNPSGNPATIYQLSQAAVDLINGLGGPTQAALATSTPLRDLSAEIAGGLIDLGSVAAPQVPALTLLDVRADATRNRIAFVRAVSSTDTEIVVADLDTDLTSAAAYQRAPLDASRHYLVDGGPPDGRRGSFSLVWNKDPARSEVMFASRPGARRPGRRAVPRLLPGHRELRVHELIRETARLLLPLLRIRKPARRDREQLGSVPGPAVGPLARGAHHGAATHGGGRPGSRVCGRRMSDRPRRCEPGRGG
jgi:hypothetical protein